MQSELEILSASGFQQETYDPLLQVVQVTEGMFHLSQRAYAVSDSRPTPAPGCSMCEQELVSWMRAHSERLPRQDGDRQSGV